MNVTRREALSTLGVSALALAAAGRDLDAAAPDQAQAAAGPYTLAPLPYAFDALEPHIDALTMQIHHDRHHQAYVNNLNTALAGAGEAGKAPLDDLLKNLAALPESVRTAVRNNGGGHVNHVQFWTRAGARCGRSARPAPSPTPSRARSAASTPSRTSSRRPRWGASAAAGPG